MGIGEWFRRILGSKREMKQIPEVVGHSVDEQGNRHEIHRGWLKHDSLTDSQVQRISNLRKVLSEAYPMTMEGWIDGFRRDANPESEIQIIEACAVVYQQLTEKAVLSSDEKGRLYAILCAISAGGVRSELVAAMPKNKDLPDLESIAMMYQEARQASRRL